MRDRAPALAINHLSRMLRVSRLTGPVYQMPGFMARVRQAMAEIERPAVCVIDHVRYIDLARDAHDLGLAVVLCPQRIESLDTALPIEYSRRRNLHAISLDFGDELAALSQADTRLCISKTEMALLAGLGQDASFYPYVPRGEWRQLLESVRLARRVTPAEPGLCLMIGSASEPSTRQGFQWFVDHAIEHGLPEGVRVVLAGSGTERFAQQLSGQAQIRVLGHISQATLEDLLRRSAAAIVPQQMGFGALTRIPEMACAGLPIFAPHYPTYALNPPPGLRALSLSWDEWRQAMASTLLSRSDVSAEALGTWEKTQPDTLVDFIASLA